MSICVMIADRDCLEEEGDHGEGEREDREGTGEKTNKNKVYRYKKMSQ